MSVTIEPTRFAPFVATPWLVHRVRKWRVVWRRGRVWYAYALTYGCTAISQGRPLTESAVVNPVAG